jgi:hypothetical protein
MNEKETKNTLTDRQCQAIPHLLAAKSLEEGCRQAKVAKNTFYSWLQNEAFREELRKQREKIVEGALETLKANMNKATETLVKLLESQNEGIQHKAAKDIIEFTVNTMEIEDLESRIEALENKIEQPKRHLRRNV